jgi:hypothetical protein
MQPDHRQGGRMCIPPRFPFVHGPLVLIPME